MHGKITEYQEKVLLNAFDGKVINQTQAGAFLKKEWYMYPVKDKKYALPCSKWGCHTINKFAFMKLISEGLIESNGWATYVISKKGMEQVLGHRDLTVIKESTQSQGHE